MNKASSNVASINEAEKLDLLETGRHIVENEAIYIEEHRWEEWLALFADDCIYWAPSWKDDNTLTSDPNVEMSHIYYTSKKALEDRMIRFTSHISPASNPRPRTAHFLSNFRLLDGTTEDTIRLRSTWVTHVFIPYEQQLTHTLFGRVEHELIYEKSNWLIAGKKIILQNDYIPTMIDIYCL